MKTIRADVDGSKNKYAILDIDISSASKQYGIIAQLFQRLFLSPIKLMIRYSEIILGHVLSLEEQLGRKKG
jgi:hypothetical protein